MDFLYMGIFNTKLYTSKSRANGLQSTPSTEPQPPSLPPHHVNNPAPAPPSSASLRNVDRVLSPAMDGESSDNAAKKKLPSSIPSYPIEAGGTEGNNCLDVDSRHFGREPTDASDCHLGDAHDDDDDDDGDDDAKIDSNRPKLGSDDGLEKRLLPPQMGPADEIDANNNNNNNNYYYYSSKNAKGASVRASKDASFPKKKKKTISEEIVGTMDREASIALEKKSMMRRSISSHDHERRSEHYYSSSSRGGLAEKPAYEPGGILKRSPDSLVEAVSNRAPSSFGNILISKASPNSGSQRSMMPSSGNNKGDVLPHTAPSSGSNSSRSSGEMPPSSRKSGEFNNAQNPKAASSSPSIHSSSTNPNKGNGSSSASSLNGGSLMVGSGNGSVVSYGGGVKCGGKAQGEIPINNNVVSVDQALLKRAQLASDPEEIKNVANEYYKRGKFSEALVLYDIIVDRCPGNSAFRSNRAAALSGLGRLAEAVLECEQAIKLDSHNARAHQRVASLYLRLGLTDQARQHLHMAGGGPQFNSVEAHCLENIEKHLRRCIEARKIRDWYKVIKESDAAVVAGADSAPQIFGYKSEALLRLHKPEDADTVCVAAQRIEAPLVKFGVLPANPFLLIIRAQLDMALGRFEKAVGAAESAARIDPNNATAATVLCKAQAVASTRMAGNEMFKSGRYFEALALYSEGLESDPSNAILLCNRAVCRSKLGQWEKAVEDCDSALRLQPNYTKALMRRASCWTKLERWEEALQDYETLRRLMPDDLEVSRGLFDVQVAIRKSRGEEVHRMKFGGDVEEVLGDEQFHDAVSSPGLSVVEFITRWSERCRQLSPFLDDLCKRNPCVNFVKVDVEENPNLARMECVSFIPTFKIYMNGQKVKEILGPTEQILEYAVKQFSM